MIAFAGNSIFCRLALVETSIDAASFTTVRLLSGAVMLWLLTLTSGNKAFGQGNWLSALALFAYAACFSFAYLSLSAATGALLLFGAVQATMIGYGLWLGQRLSALQMSGFVLACTGLIGLLLPGISAPPLFGSLLMLASGIAWAIYSLRGQNSIRPLDVTAGNFLMAVPMAVLLSLVTASDFTPDPVGIAYGVASGALASGIGYAIWYMVLPNLKAASAATIQLSVPVLVAISGVLFLAEPITIRMSLASIAILGGIAMVILERKRI